MSEEEKKFRVNRKKFGFTYSCPRHGDCQNMSAQDKKDGKHIEGCACTNPIKDNQALVDFLMDKGGSCDYIVAHELHKSGKSHYHAYVKYAEEFQTTNPRMFDMCGCHPRIENPGKGWIPYITKDFDFVSNYYGISPWITATKMDTPEEAVEFLWETMPQEMCKYAHNISQNIHKRMRTSELPKALQWEGPYPSSFYPPVWDRYTHTLLLVGEPGINKTEFAKYLLGDHHYIKGSLQGLKNILFDKPLLLDEINMLDEDPEQSKEISDVINGGTIKMRYGDVIIPPGVPRIIINNFKPLRDPHKAVYGRRVLVHRIPPISGSQDISPFKIP